MSTVVWPKGDQQASGEFNIVKALRSRNLVQVERSFKSRNSHTRDALI